MRSNVNLVLRLCQKLQIIYYTYIYILYIYIYIYHGKAGHVISSHRERSHHSFYDGVGGGLRQASIPVGIQRLHQLVVFGSVVFGA